MLPEGFRSLKSLRALNIYAVAASLAALTGAAFSSMGMSHDSSVVSISMMTTLVVGGLWARVMRSRKRVTSFKIRQGWLWSPVFAMSNAALAAGFLLSLGEHGGNPFTRFALGLVAGATYGAIIWIPALLLTLLCFGFPIARAQHLAERGLAGEENGERIVGVASAGLGLVAPVVALSWSRSSDATTLVSAVGASAAIAGVIAAVLATARALRRTAFVKDAEAGKVAGYRVESAPEGKVLIRVEASGNEAYRAGERFEAVYELANDGEAKRALVNE